MTNIAVGSIYRKINGTIKITVRENGLGNVKTIMYFMYILLSIHQFL